MTTPFLVADRITKRFPGVVALDGVSVGVRPGEVLAIVGENGAGKSTLMKVLAGVYRPDGGSLTLDGKPAEFRTPADALDAGVVLIHQELSLAENLSVADNLFLGREQTGAFGWLHRRAMAEVGARLIARVGLDDGLLHARAGSLSPGQKQLVEIARALGQKARLLIMDEPTSSLTQTETDRLYEVIDALKADGVAVGYISHRLAEVARVADRVVVLRDGKFSGEVPRAEVSHDALVKLMVGRELAGYFPRAHRDRLTGDRPTLMTFDKVRFAGDRGHPVSFELRAGEVFGMGGLVGAGRTELAEAAFGLRERTAGTVTLAGEPYTADTPRRAVREGVLLAPEDRRLNGLITEASVGFNVALPNLDAVSDYGWLSGKREAALHADVITKLRVKTPSARQPVGLLSGGNQQKVVFGKWLARGPKVLILDEPTRGVDVGSKAEIYALIDELCGRGVAVWMVTSDMEELLGPVRPRRGAARGATRRRVAARGRQRTGGHDLGDRGEPHVKRIAGVALLLVAMYALLGASSDRAFYKANLVEVANRQGYSGVIVLAAGLIILSGGIDLSLGSVIALGAVGFGMLIDLGIHPYIALVLTMFGGTLIGLGQGALVHYVRLQAFLVTLCGMFVFRGVARYLAADKEVGLTSVIGRHPEFKGAVDNLTLALVGLSPETNALIFPGTLAVLAVLAVLFAAVLQGTVHGRYWLALGYSEDAARYAGVPVARYRVASFGIASTLGALAGVILILNYNSVKPDNAGLTYELQAITGAVLGGVSLRGGEGTVIGMILGAAVLPTLNNLMIFRGVPDALNPVVIGLTLLAGSVADEAIRRRGAQRR